MGNTFGKSRKPSFEELHQIMVNSAFRQQSMCFEALLNERQSSHAVSTLGEMTMCNQSIINRSLQAAFLFLLSFVGSFAFAQAPVIEQALTQTADDPQLKWGPCPPFLPKGCAIAVLHGDPAKDNVDVFFKVPAKSSIPLHWHTSAERMILVAGELHVTYDGQKTTVLKSGTYAYGPAKRTHRGFCASDVPCVLFIAFESPLDAVPVENTGK